jgi:polynucleotide 5'-hydroxyl-kinase GRC3/NOL9
LSEQRLQSGRTLLIEGPALLKLSEGEASCLGAPLQENSRVTVREDRQLPIETPSEATLQIRLGSGGKYRIETGSPIPTGWKEASDVLRQAPGTVVILGSVDSGKTTLCTFLANENLRHGNTVRVIDGDVGQADIGPPTTISVSFFPSFVSSLQDLRPDLSLFIGDTTPSSVPDKLSTGLLRLRNFAADRSNVTIINTDGWTNDEDAFKHKLQLLNSLQPDFAFGIDPTGEIDGLLENVQSTVLKLDRSPFARTRSREERKRVRESGYKRFLQGARRVELSLRDVKLRRFNSFRQLKIGGEGDLRGLIAGMIDDEERLLAICRVEKLRGGVLTVKTVLETRPKIVELGAVVLSSSYEELGYDS